MFVFTNKGGVVQQLITRENVEQAADCIRERVDVDPGAVAIILGSGMGEVASAIEDATFMDYANVPHMVASTAPLHAGRFVFGNIADRQVICMQGRLHAYEGNAAQQIAFPVFVMHALGAEELIVTNAAGGINPAFEVGDLMLIEDHINLLGMNPCAGSAQPELMARFFDMTQAYDAEMRERAKAAARSCGIELEHGVYIATMGPSFETPAEIRAFRTLGADAVGMSTVLEVIAARACDMRVMGISMISNPAAGVLDEPLSMDDVQIAANEAAAKVGRLIVEFLRG